MKQLEKYAAAQRALKLMSGGGKDAKRFFRDLMERQKGLTDFGPQRQKDLIADLGGEPGGGWNRGDAVRTLKRLLRQGESYADDFTHVNSMIPRITDTGRGGASINSREQLLHRRRRQMDAADGHAFALRRQQKAKRNDASEIDALLSLIKPS